MTTKYADAFADELNKKIENYDFTVEHGKRFDKIVQAYGKGNPNFPPQRSVHAFVEKETGALIKPASWKAPQKNADGTLSKRYDLSAPEDFQRALDAAEFSGGYLYARS